MRYILSASKGCWRNVLKLLHFLLTPKSHGSKQSFFFFFTLNKSCLTLIRKSTSYIETGQKRKWNGFSWFILLNTDHDKKSPNVSFVGVKQVLSYFLSFFLSFFFLIFLCVFFFLFSSCLSFSFLFFYLLSFSFFLSFFLSFSYSFVPFSFFFLLFFHFPFFSFIYSLFLSFFFSFLSSFSVLFSFIFVCLFVSLFVCLFLSNRIFWFYLLDFAVRYILKLNCHVFFICVCMCVCVCVCVWERERERMLMSWMVSAHSLPGRRVHLKLGSPLIIGGLPSLYKCQIIQIKVDQNGIVDSFSTGKFSCKEILFHL